MAAERKTRAAAPRKTTPPDDHPHPLLDQKIVTAVERLTNKAAEILVGITQLRRPFEFSITWASAEADLALMWPADSCARVAVELAAPPWEPRRKGSDELLQDELDEILINVISRRITARNLDGSWLQLDCNCATSGLAERDAARSLMDNVLVDALRLLRSAGRRAAAITFSLATGQAAGKIEYLSDRLLSRCLEPIQGIVNSFRAALAHVLPPVPADPRQELQQIAALSAGFRQEIKPRLEKVVRKLLQENPPRDVATRGVLAKQINAILKQAGLSILHPDFNVPASLHVDHGNVKLITSVKVPDEAGHLAQRHAKKWVDSLPPLVLIETLSLKHLACLSLDSDSAGPSIGG